MSYLTTSEANLALKDLDQMLAMTGDVIQLQTRQPPRPRASRGTRARASGPPSPSPP